MEIIYNYWFTELNAQGKGNGANSSLEFFSTYIYTYINRKKNSYWFYRSLKLIKVVLSFIMWELGT